MSLVCSSQRKPWPHLFGSFSALGLCRWHSLPCHFFSLLFFFFSLILRYSSSCRFLLEAHFTTLSSSGYIPQLSFPLSPIFFPFSQHSSLILLFTISSSEVQECLCGLQAVPPVLYLAYPTKRYLINTIETERK